MRHRAVTEVATLNPPFGWLPRWLDRPSAGWRCSSLVERCRGPARHELAALTLSEQTHNLAPGRGQRDRPLAGYQTGFRPGTVGKVSDCFLSTVWVDEL